METEAKDESTSSPDVAQEDRSYALQAAIVRYALCRQFRVSQRGGLSIYQHYESAKDIIE
jgi:hypothetical protein